MLLWRPETNCTKYTWYCLVLAVFHSQALLEHTHNMSRTCGSKIYTCQLVAWVYLIRYYYISLDRYLRLFKNETRDGHGLRTEYKVICMVCLRSHVGAVPLHLLFDWQLLDVLPTVHLYPWRHSYVTVPWNVPLVTFCTAPSIASGKPHSTPVNMSRNPMSHYTVLEITCCTSSPIASISYQTRAQPAFILPAYIPTTVTV